MLPRDPVQEKNKEVSACSASIFFAGEKWDW